MTVRFFGQSLLLTTLLIGTFTSTPAADTLHLDLPQCIDRAKHFSATARAIRLDYASQCADHDAARADYLPQLSLNASLPGYTRAIIPVLQPDGSYRYVPQTQAYSDAGLSLMQRIPFTGGDLSVNSSLDNRANLLAGDDRSWSATPLNVQLRQPLTGFNAYSYARDQDELRFALQQRSFIEQMEDCSAQAAGRFFDYYIACMNVENAQQNIVLNDSIRMLAQGRFNVGKIAENDLLQYELEGLSAKNEYERALLSKQRSLAALQLQIGLSAETPISIITPPSAKEITLNEQSIMNYAMTHRSEVVGYQSQLVEAERSVAQAKVNNRFNASLIASYGLNQTASQFGATYRNLLDQEGLTLTLSMPLIGWSKFSDQVESAQAQQDRIRVQAEAHTEELRQEILYDLRDFAQLASLLNISLRSQTIAARRYEVARNRYIIGKIETTELMLAQKEKDDALRSYYTSLREYWVSYYRLRKTTLFDIDNNRGISAEDEN